MNTRDTRFLFTISEEHFYKPVVNVGGINYSMSFMGGVRPWDLGKRVYLVDGILQVENNEQRDKRLGGRP